MIQKQKTKFPSHIKQGDTVKILAGKDKGKIGEIIKINKVANQVVVKEINIKRKHVKPTREGDVGKISQFEGAIHSSNVMLYNTEERLASRVTYTKNEEGKNIRIFKKLLNKK
uniref:Ribosomal protein L24 n=1 Tax=Chroomonas placoidea TaxID=173977 RepID=A0A222AIB6_9CRYP|nr:ribosomal protein L24 [Chroomonas placoidea]ASO76120.1 ribosomal protein L24 [Chroomonas placoidea]